IGHWPLEAQEEYFADGPDTLASTSFRGTEATVTPVAGGYMVSGRWEFSSGCDVASWAMLGGNVERQRLNFLIPRADWQIDDNGPAAAPRGRGSKDSVTPEPVFGPAYRVAPSFAGGENSLGWQIHRRPSYHDAGRAMLGFNFACVILGTAQ